MIKAIDEQILKVAISALLLAAAFISGNSFAKPTIKIKSHVNITQVREIKLSDVAEFENVDDEQVKKLGKLSLGMAPKAGERRMYNSLGLSQMFRYHMGGNNSQMRLVIPSEIVIENSPPQLNEENIKLRLAERWNELCKTCTFDFTQVSVPIIPEELKLQPWKLMIPYEKPKGSFNIQARVTIPNVAEQIYWVSGHVRMLEDVPVAKRQMSVGERLFAEDFEIKKMDITHAQDTWPTQKEWTGRQLGQGLKAGDVLFNSKLSKDLAVKRGDLIKVIGLGDGYEVLLSGVAKRQAMIGEAIEVENLESKKILVGKVSAQGEVTVDLE